MKKNFFERFSDHPVCFTWTIILVTISACFYFSETWQLFINTILMLVMVFIIQKTQNKYPKEIQIKLTNLFISKKRATISLVKHQKFNIKKIQAS
ncbi:low affinity iron permease family protein [Chryseobacterium indoltheticum]|jgi:low affinity Fe/Cu permease|uniref:low affinity iron permease family protein n=1 Tax=Chryseobacterium indoltheticum TaxID=254 RepID=UPI0019122B31|nr:low affinity iron permease family protein [Chryseobacterium indoltheticum]